MHKKNERFWCIICKEHVDEYSVIMSPYNDPYCSRCDELKKKFPRKTPDELKKIIPKKSGDFDLLLNIIIVLIATLVVFLFLG